MFNAFSLTLNSKRYHCDVDYSKHLFVDLCRGENVITVVYDKKAKDVCETNTTKLFLSKITRKSYLYLWSYRRLQQLELETSVINSFNAYKPFWYTLKTACLSFLEAIIECIVVNISTAAGSAAVVAVDTSNVDGHEDDSYLNLWCHLNDNVWADIHICSSCVWNL